MDPTGDVWRISGPWVCLNLFSTSLITFFLQNCLSPHSYDPRIDELLNTMLVAVNSILQIPLDRKQHKRDSMEGIGVELNILASLMDDFAHSISKWQGRNHTHNSKFGIIPLSPEPL